MYGLQRYWPELPVASTAFTMAIEYNIILFKCSQAFLTSLPWANTIQLSPEGEVNSGGYIPRRLSLRSQNSEYPRIYQVTGANQNARKLLSSDLVNTKNGYLNKVRPVGLHN